MPYLVLGIAVLIGLLLLLRGAAQADPRVLRQIFLWTGLAIGIVLIVYLAVAGRLGIAAFAALIMMPTLLRMRRLFQMSKSTRGPTPGRSSDVSTRYLEMHLDHDTGTLDGRVLDGVFAGRMLSTMSLDEQLKLLYECRDGDSQSAEVLEAYIDRVHGPDWRNHDRGTGSRWGRGTASEDPDRMAASEAWEILGLEPNAAEAEIKDAHRRMMQQHHPDHGGSAEMAAKINRAKDVLLSS